MLCQRPVHRDRAVDVLAAAADDPGVWSARGRVPQGRSVRRRRFAMGFIWGPRRRRRRHALAVEADLWRGVTRALVYGEV